MKSTGIRSSLWPVFDDAAYLLTRRFYEAYLSKNGAERMAPAAALREAQAWLRSLTRAEAAALLPDGDAYGRGAGLRFDLAQEAPAVDLNHAEAPFAALHEWAGFVVTGV